MAAKTLKAKDILLLLLIIALTVSLVFAGKWTTGIAVFYNLSFAINKQILYRPITLFYRHYLLIHPVEHEKSGIPGIPAAGMLVHVNNGMANLKIEIPELSEFYPGKLTRF